MLIAIRGAFSQAPGICLHYRDLELIPRVAVCCPDIFSRYLSSDSLFRKPRSVLTDRGFFVISATFTAQGPNMIPSFHVIYESASERMAVIMGR